MWQVAGCREVLGIWENVGGNVCRKRALETHVQVHADCGVMCALCQSPRPAKLRPVRDIVNTGHSQIMPVVWLVVLYPDDVTSACNCAIVRILCYMDAWLVLCCPIVTCMFERTKFVALPLHVHVHGFVV